MTDTKATPSSTPGPSSINLSKLISALQSLGIEIPADGHETQPATPAVTPTVSAPKVTPSVSARITSPWVPTSVVPLPTTTSAPVRAQSSQNQVPIDHESPAVGASTTSTSAMIPVEAPSGFTCQHCQQYNVLRSAGDTWYTVTAGRNVGVFRGWHRVQPLVSGVPHASYRKYWSEAAATTAFEDAQSQGVVVIIA